MFEKLLFCISFAFCMGCGDTADPSLPSEAGMTSGEEVNPAGGEVNPAGEEVNPAGEEVNPAGEEGTSECEMTCAEEETQCSERGDVVRCERDIDGCLSFVTLAECGVSQTCELREEGAVCSPAEPDIELEFSDYQILTSSYLDGDTAGTGGIARDIEFDDAGNFVIVGGVHSTDFVTTPGAYDTEYGGPGTPQVGTFGSMDAFVSKFDASGNLLWSTYLGGPSYDRAYAVEIADNGDVIVAGRAGADFPTTPGVLQETFAGDNNMNTAYGPQDGFVSRISADGSSLIWSTYFGADGQGIIRDIDIDASGRILIGFSSAEGNFSFSPQITGPRGTLSGGSDAYYGKLSSDGSTLLFGTYIGGSDGGSKDGFNPSIRADGDVVYFFTYTESSDVDCITPNAHQNSNAGQSDMLLVRFDENDQISFCTYYGGSGIEEIETHSLAIDDVGDVYITGYTSSPDLTVTAAAAQQTPSHVNSMGGVEGLVAKFTPDGELIASTYVGMPSAVDEIIALTLEGIVIAPNGDVILGGSDRPYNRNTRNAMIIRMNEDLDEILHLQTYGGSGRDEIRAVAVNADGDVAYAGHTTSTDWPTISAYDSTYNSSPNASPTFVILQPQR